MALRVRTSINLGPMRFNLSQSGVGVSVGVKGFRVGTGPRGNYVRMSAMGVRMSFTEGSSALPEQVRPSVPQPPPSGDYFSNDGILMKEIESGAVGAMTDSNASQLLAELNDKRQRAGKTPVAIIGSVLCLAILALGAPGWLMFLAAIGCLMLCLRVHKLDQFEASTVIFYELTPEVQEAFERLQQWFEALCARERIWHISASGHVHDRKYHGGASNLINRQPIKPGMNLISTLHTNIDIPMIPVGRQILAFMPETLLVFDRNAVGAVPYQGLEIKAITTSMIEEESVPRDAKQVGMTWAKVNRDGGPDRRFKENRQLPILEYEEIDITSKSGLNERIQHSKAGVGESFGKSCRALSAFAKPDGSAAKAGQKAR